MSSSSPPATTDWIAAWAAVGAAVGTFGTLVATAITLRIQVRANLRGQASHITVKREIEGEDSYFVVHNWSDLPIFYLRGEVRFYKSRTSLGSGKSKNLEPEHSDVVAPNADARILLPKASDGHKAMSGHITFLDAAGFTWSRNWLTGGLRLEAKYPRLLRTWFWLTLVAFVCLISAGSAINDMIRSGPSVSTVLDALLLTFIGILAVVMIFVRPFLPLGHSFQVWLHAPRRLRHQLIPQQDHQILRSVKPLWGRPHCAKVSGFWVWCLFF